ncbi:integrase arm-type DNA-binding domain-containing protein [Peteryoungia desertarenae]|uniref:Integrase arm-type DNA-binding domain-containing protein n=1 Tax=Peteryoungia desertarenae TaxID=1813451 RepID=A0ABX6QJ66_9HYPH|nr:site-specific integrase [Peteryoungia desertarenae]QLF68327.1 integrase arm-type DNA-binding domain-containing protein [Peteryoungia desertarenae]
MARHKLTDSKIRALSKPGIYSDGDGLYLRVQSTGSRSWVFIWKRYGSRREIGLGPFGSGSGHVSLAAARAKAEEARQIVGQGGDPKTDLAERKAALQTATFGSVADEYRATMAPKWKSDKTVAKWKRFAETHAKAIRKVPVADVSTDDVLKVIRPLWSDKPETAGNIRECVKLVLDHAKARGLRTGDNPAEWKGHLDQILPPPKKLVRGHHAAMPFAEISEFFTRLATIGGVGARALEFTILTAVRSGETRGATWEEIDLEGKVWTIPAIRMKGGKEHRVPLSPRAIALLTEMRARQINDLVFPGAKGHSPLSDMTLAKALKAAGGTGYTVHGFRSTFRDWAAEATNFQREVAEAALAHAVGDAVERAYRRGDALEKRRQLMEAWEGYVLGKAASVTKIRAVVNEK